MIKELYQKLQKGEESSESLCRHYLQVIQERDPELNAFLEVYEKEEILEQARSIDRRRQAGEELGMLAGLPCALKDVINLQGKKTTAASKMMENYLATEDAEVVRRLKEAGVIFLGKTNMDEFAMGASGENSAFGPTKNPHDPTRVPGGSSSGSAVAVAAGMAPFALGTDTGGSIRQPAGFCGVVGFKPTYGRVSRRNVFPMATSYDQVGPLAQTVEDAALILREIAGYDPQDNTTIKKSGLKKQKIASLGKNDLTGKKIGYVKDFFEKEGLDPEVKEIIQGRLHWAEKQGAKIVEVQFPNFNYSLATYYLMITSEVSSNMARIDGIKYGFNISQQPGEEKLSLIDVYKKSRAQGLGAEVKRRIILGTYALSAGYYDAYYKKAQAVRELIKGDLKKIFQEVDCLVAPTSPTPPFKLGEKADDPLAMYLADVYTVTANVAMIPAISLPAGRVEREGKKLPVGLQLWGKWWDDWKLLEIAHQFELKN